MSKSLNISSVLVANLKAQYMHLSLPLRYKNTDGEQIIETQILLDSGAEGLFMNQTFIEKNWIPMIPLLKLITPQTLTELPTNQEESPTVPGPILSLMINNSWLDSLSWTPEKVMSF